MASMAGSKGGCAKVKARLKKIRKDKTTKEENKEAA
jgi:hypothetical protein